MRPGWTRLRLVHLTLALTLVLALTLTLVLVSVLSLKGPRQEPGTGWGRRGRFFVPIYVSSWAVLLPGGSREAERLARKFGFVNLGQVIQGQHYYHFQHRGVAARALSQHWGHSLRLKKDPKVHWFEQQTLKRRVKRENFVLPTDPWFSKQWYMNKQVHPDLNILEAWKKGYTGQGVVVSILDDGIEKDHPDLQANYDHLASYDFNDHDPDPQPRYTLMDDNRHGTRCAGEVAAVANNGICGVGVAYNAKIGGVRMLDGPITDIVEAQSLSFQPQHIHIYSASWGPEDDGRTVDGPGVLAQEAFSQGVNTGRSNLGTLFVWASGNGGLHFDNCNCDGYTNSIYTLSVGSTTQHGLVPWYSEACASTLTTTFSSGLTNDDGQIVTTDLHHRCTDKHTGTSASAPLAAGMIALALEANPFLTWRDMQHLVVRASKPAQLQAEDWATNGVGRKVSHHYGYGLLDGGLLVDLAKKWRITKPQLKCSIKVISSPIPIKPRTQVRRNVSACRGDDPHIRSLEHVQVQLSLTYSRRGDLEITLTSPMGTHSTLVAVRPFDTSSRGYKNWIFMSTHFWDEDPQGIWTLELENKGYYYNFGTLQSYTLILYGTEENMLARKLSTQVTSECLQWDPKGLCQKCISPYYILGRFCLSYCPPRYFNRTRRGLRPEAGHPASKVRVCASCHPSCYTCQGHSAHACTACPPHYTLNARTHSCSPPPTTSSLSLSRSQLTSSLPLAQPKQLKTTTVVILAVACSIPLFFCTVYFSYQLLRSRLGSRHRPCCQAGAGPGPGPAYLASRTTSPGMATSSGPASDLDSDSSSPG
ncbi:proprotein convertase subtilisin/kexin type 4 [Dromiciops gliroides]|uniref:proprotein convertase subtilisin/kexin type 4 n=1 Tax=Dromiciops gliroides TaxID=33562 RepID=UPI001CC5B6F0|nr:proprotein convertase subtilisin/kexin type 4 [Dromiciops gliroides]